MAGIYIHIPYCARKCLYCDFYSIGSRRAPWQRYVDALLAEAEQRKEECAGEPIDTFYLGGGTPSQMPDDELLRLTDGLTKIFHPRFKPLEATIEVNPDDVDSAKADTLLRAGFNRVSMGIQSFRTDELAILNRRHSPEKALEAYTILRDKFSNISIDLMYGLPYQTLDSWESTLKKAVALHPEHISAYSLMWEEGTALTKMRTMGKVSEAPDSLSVAMYELLIRELQSVGYEHYEISNFALPGLRSRHNSSYWTGIPYIGLGASAHSYDGARRRCANMPDAARYIDVLTDARQRHTELKTFEILSDEELHDEYIMTRLRVSDGIDTQHYADRFGRNALHTLLKKSVPHVDAGRLLLDGARLRLSELGMMVSDDIIVDLM